MAKRRERIILDPVEVAFADRIAINLHEGAIQIGEAGPDWGDDALTAYKAEEGRMGEAMIDYRLPNRIIAIPLLLGMTGSFDAARIALQAWVSRVREEGGWLKREVIGGDYGEAGEKLFADIENATLKLSDDTFVAADGFDANALLTLEALPDFYGEVIEEEAFEGVGTASQVHQINGNLPGRADIEVEDASGSDQLGLGWHFRCRNYDSSETAAWTYGAEALTPLDSAAEVELEGASGGVAVRHDNLATSWTPVLGTNLDGGSFLTHRGLYDVWANVYTTSEDPPWLRLLYDVGDSISPRENTQVKIPAKEALYTVPLGQIDLRETPFGPHRWQGMIQGVGENGGENIYLDEIFFFNADEGSGILRGSPVTAVSLEGFKAQDPFNQAKGMLDGVALPDGTGNWDTAGDAGDFELTGDGAVVRTAKNDGGGRIAKAPIAAYERGAAQIRFRWSSLPTEKGTSLYSNLWFTSIGVISAHYGVASDGSISSFFFMGGTEMPFAWQPGVTYTLVTAVADGFIVGWIADATGRQITPVTTKPVAETSGAPYFEDFYNGEEEITRIYDDFAAWESNADMVIFANRIARLSWQGMFRQDPTGEAYGDILNPGSDLPRVPVSGPEERPVEIALKASRGDFGLVPDFGSGKVIGQLKYRPCWSHVPAI